MPISSVWEPANTLRPVSNTVASSTNVNANAAFCSTTTIDRSASRRSRAIASYTLRAVDGAKPNDASSRSRTLGLP